MTFENYCGALKTNSSVRGNKDAKRVYEFLADNTRVAGMAVLSDSGLPPITYVASDIEHMMFNSTEFNMKEITNRQTVGKMISHILSCYGYKSLNKRAQLRKFSKSYYFTTGLLYAKDANEPMRPIQVIVG